MLTSNARVSRRPRKLIRNRPTTGLPRLSHILWLVVAVQHRRCPKQYEAIPYWINPSIGWLAPLFDVLWWAGLRTFAVLRREAYTTGGAAAAGGKWVPHQFAHAAQQVTSKSRFRQQAIATAHYNRLRNLRQRLMATGLMILRSPFVLSIFRFQLTCRFPLCGEGSSVGHMASIQHGNQLGSERMRVDRRQHYRITRRSSHEGSLSPTRRDASLNIGTLHATKSITTAI
jgi:hypothetical protein